MNCYHTSHTRDGVAGYVNAQSKSGSHFDCEYGARLGEVVRELDEFGSRRVSRIRWR